MYCNGFFYTLGSGESEAIGARLRDQRERRLRELLDRRQTLVSQIEQLRSARELLFPAENSVPSSSSSSSSSATSNAATAGSEADRDGVWDFMLDLGQSSTAAAPSPSSAATTPSSQVASNDVSANNPPSADAGSPSGGRTIDEWAVNRRLLIQRRRLERTLSEHSAEADRRLTSYAARRSRQNLYLRLNDRNRRTVTR